MDYKKLAIFVLLAIAMLALSLPASAWWGGLWGGLGNWGWGLGNWGWGLGSWGWPWWGSGWGWGGLGCGTCGWGGWAW